MDNLDEIYFDLTQVDITKQKELWDERGKGYYGEYLVFQKLYSTLPGFGKILMNLQIPVDGGKTTEVDLLLIHETGLYLFEIKHYKGTIYGKGTDATWTQYFRTTQNSHFNSPVLQNQYHVDALKKLYPNIPLHSIVVFTNQKCDLRITEIPSDVVVCKLEVLQEMLSRKFRCDALFSEEKMDEIFRQLVPYSPISRQTITTDTKEMPFHLYLNDIIREHQQKQQQLEESHRQQEATMNRTLTYKLEYYESQNKARKKSAWWQSVFTIGIAAAFCIVVFSLYHKNMKEKDALINETIAAAQQQIIENNQKAQAEIDAAKQDAQAEVNAAKQELENFKQKFEHVEPYNNGEISFNAPLVTASDVVLRNSPDVQNAAEFSCTLNWNGTDYGVWIPDEARIIVMLSSGEIQEYKIFSKEFPSYSFNRELGKNKKEKIILPIYEIYNTTIEEIEYIKIIDTKIWKADANHGYPLFGGYEIELYNAET